jgi:hypothetical protein
MTTTTTPTPTQKATSPSSSSTVTPAGAGEGGTPPGADPENPGAAVGAAPGFDCSWCGKTFATGRGLGGHRRWCGDKPHAAKVAAGQAPAKVDKTGAAGTPAAPAAPAATVAGEVPPGVAAAAATPTPESVEARARQAAKVFTEAEAAGGGTAATVARLEAAGIGVADLIAMCCALFLPPELSPSEYAMLQRAWGPVLNIPGWLVKIVVTVMVLGPRIKAHPELGPWFREQLTGNKAPPDHASVQAPVVTPAPAQPTAAAPEPAPPSNGASSPAKAPPMPRRRSRTPGDYPTRERDMDKRQRDTWGSV